MVISVTRGIAQYKYFHAPMSLMNHLEAYEIPRILNSTGHVFIPPPRPGPKYRVPESAEEEPRIDYDLINPFKLTLCYGKEWHRFPGSFLVPDGVKIEWIKSEFDGMLPGHFKRTLREGPLLSRVHGTRIVPYGLNDLNEEEPSFYASSSLRYLDRSTLIRYTLLLQVDVKTCDYLVDSDFPLHPMSTPLEPRYAIDTATWDRVKCEPFLDARYSPMLTRIVWLPGKRWQALNEYGEICLLRNKKSMTRKEKALTVHHDAH